MKEEQRRSRRRRLIVRVGRAVYPAIDRPWMGWLVRTEPVQRFKRSIIHTPADRALAILDLLAAAEIPMWVAGGWGVDALLGRQTRRHCDIDLLISDDGQAYQHVAHVLAREGFRFVLGHHTPGIHIPWCYVWCHDDGHRVEVLPVAMHEPPFAAGRADAGGVRQPFTEGVIGGRPVPCLSAELQVLLHAGYPLRDIDVRDLELLRAYLELPEQAATP